MTPRPARADRSRAKIAVLGAGNVGCFIGGRLAPAADVTLIGRPSVLVPIRLSGLTLIDIDDSATHVPGTDLAYAAAPATSAETAASGPVPLTEPAREAVDTADIVLVTVKSRSTMAAAASLQPHLRPETVVISIQNGLHNAHRLRHVLGPTHTVLTSMWPSPIRQVEPGVFRQGTLGELKIQDSPAAATFLEVARAVGLPVEVRADIEHVLYGKLLYNLNNGLNALSGLPLRDQLMDRDYRRVLARCQDEAIAAFHAQGVVPAQFSPIPPSLMTKVLRLPNPAFTKVAKSSLRVHSQATSSTREDLQAGRPTEIDELQGEIVRQGKLAGVSTPVCERVVALVREAEHSGPRGLPTWSGSDLYAAVVGGRHA